MIEVLIEEIMKRMSRGMPMHPIHRSRTQNRQYDVDKQILNPDEFLDYLYDLELQASKSSLNSWDSNNAAGFIANELIGRRLESLNPLDTLHFIQDSGLAHVANDMSRTVINVLAEVFETILIDESRFPRISSFLREAVSDPNKSRDSSSSIHYDRNRIMYRILRTASSQLKNSIDTLQDNFVQRDKAWNSKISFISDDSIVLGAAELDDYLARSVHYLGPLRAAPSSAADYSRRGSDRGVGPEGQHLAYQLMMNPTVSGFVWKIESKDRQDFTVEGREASLSEAMTYWVMELGLATSVRAEEIPGVGDSIKLKVPGVKSELSPNDVGVGVSQALPVIGAVLLANPGDLVVLEQPELHLHPDAQLQLAEFFVAAMKSGRRLLIESHSEHFLNKLRLMTARAEAEVAEELIEKVGFVFAERDADSGVSQFREVLLTSDGSVQNWPRGFFDQGSNTAKELFLIRQKRSRT
jgi:hypothetical protein